MIARLTSTARAISAERGCLHPQRVRTREDRLTSLDGVPRAWLLRLWRAALRDFPLSSRFTFSPRRSEAKAGHV